VMQQAESPAISASATLPEDEVGSSIPKKSPSPDTIDEGTWEVGSDVKPGKYKTKGALPGAIPMCYWDVKIGEEFKDQGVKDKAGEQGIVTLKKGQVFTTSGCEPWYASK